MKRIVYEASKKYVLASEYNGFGIYQEKTPSGFLVHQSWLISNGNVRLIIESFNNLCEEEVLNIIDNYNETNKFGVKAVMYCGALHMHDGGKWV